MSSVPRVVPQREPAAREQVAAVGGGGEVGARGRDDQVRERERRRDASTPARGAEGRSPPPAAPRAGRSGAPRRRGCDAAPAPGSPPPSRSCPAGRATASGRRREARRSSAWQRPRVGSDQSATGCMDRACPTRRAPARRGSRGSRAGRREHVRGRAAVQAQDRALGALVEVVEHALIHSSGIGRGVTLVSREATAACAGSSAPSTTSPSTGVRQTRAIAVPAVAGQQRHGVDDDQALDPLGEALRRTPGRPRPSRARRGCTRSTPASSRKRSRKRS